MIDIWTFLVIVFATLALTTVFYAAVRPGPVLVKTGIAAVGFLVLVTILVLSAAL